MVEVTDFMREFFSAFAIGNGVVVFFSPFGSISSQGSISFNFWTGGLHAIVWVSCLNNMGREVSLTTPHGFSGLVVQVFDGSIVVTVWWWSDANFHSVVVLAFWCWTGNCWAWSCFWILVKFWHHTLHLGDGGHWSSDRFAHSSDSHHVGEVNCWHYFLF